LFGAARIGANRSGIPGRRTNWEDNRRWKGLPTERHLDIPRLVVSAIHGK
jgi:hypothetical protein